MGLNNQEQTPIAHVETHMHVQRLENALTINNLEALTACFEQQPKIDPNSSIKDQRLIHHTIYHNKPAQFDIIVEAGANINLANADGDTPLHFACRLERYTFINKLMSDKRIQLLRRNQAGFTAYDILKSQPKPKSPEAQKILDALRDATILTAAKYNDIETIKKHVNKNNCNKGINSRQKYLLNISAKNGDMKIAEYLLSCGASTAVKDSHGNSPLHLAVANNQPLLVRLLLDKQANPNAENDDDTSVLQSALRSHAKYKASEKLQTSQNYSYSECQEIIGQIVIKENPAALILTPENLRNSPQLIYQINSETKCIYLFSSLSAKSVSPVNISTEIIEFSKLCLQRAMTVKADLKIIYLARLHNKFTNYACNTDGEIFIVNSLAGYKEYDQVASSALQIAISTIGLPNKDPIFTFEEGSALRNVNDANVLAIEAARALCSSKKFKEINARIKGIFNKSKNRGTLPQLYIKNDEALHSHRYLDPTIADYLKLSELSLLKATDKNGHISKHAVPSTGKMSSPKIAKRKPSRSAEKKSEQKDKPSEKPVKKVHFAKDENGNILKLIHEFEKYDSKDEPEISPEEIADEIFKQFSKKNHLSIAEVKSVLSQGLKTNLDAIVLAANKIKNQHRMHTKFGCCNLSMPRFFYNKDKAQRLNKTEQKAWGALKKTYLSVLQTGESSEIREQITMTQHRKFINFHRRNWRFLTFGNTNLRVCVKKLLREKSRAPSLH